MRVTSTWSPLSTTHRRLTCGGDAVESNERIKAGGGSSQGATEAEGHEAPDSIITAHIGRRRQVPEAYSTAILSRHFCIHGLFVIITATGTLPCNYGYIYKGFLSYLPVVRVSFDKAGDDDEQENEHVDGSEDFVDPGRLLHAKRQETLNGMRVKNVDIQ